jgi:hypothetical protein
MSVAAPRPHEVTAGTVLVREIFVHWTVSVAASISLTFGNEWGSNYLRTWRALV